MSFICINKMKGASHLPLRWVLVIPFLLQLSATVGLTGWVSWRNSHQAVNDVARQLRLEVSGRIQQKLKDFLALPHYINQTTADAVIRGEIWPLSPNSEMYFSQQAQQYPFTSYIYFGSSENGAFIGASPAKPIQISIGDPSNAFRIEYFSVDKLGKRDQKLSQDSDPYDSRTRPWFQEAIQKGKPVWSEIYPDSTFPFLVITASQPVFDPQQHLVGVAAVDLYLNDISQFLQSLTVGKTGQTFILEPSGLVIANSSPDLPFRRASEDRPPERIHAQESTNPVIQAAFSSVIKQGVNLETVQEVQVEVANQKQFVQIVPYQDQLGINWQIWVVLPENDFLAQIQKSNQQTVLLSLLTLGLALILGIVTARWLSQPITCLSLAAEAIAGGNLKKSLPPSPISELDRLGSAFNQMAQQLAASFQALTESNQTLEHQVTQRTHELQVANQEIKLLYERLQQENLRMSSELEITRRLQEMILPREDELKAIPDLDIAGFMQPATEVGGDYYDILTHNGRVKIGIGDVTGHGLESGVLMIMAQTAVRALTAVQESDPIRFLTALNTAVYGNLQRMSSEKNMTLVLLDYDRGQLSIVGQHEEIIVVRHKGNVERIDTIDLGFPIGLEADISPFVTCAELSLHEGDIVVLYTDGITEAENSHREYYGLERLCEIARHHSLESAATIRAAIIQDLRAFIAQHKVYDDVTLLVIKKRLASVDS
jgi:sigma-B regulation protein RsbU (phosphoserine phosphatase)